VGLCIVIVTLFVLAHLLEWEIGYMAQKSLLVNADWKEEDRKLSRQNAQRIQNSERNPLIQSKGILVPPVTPQRKRIMVIGDSFAFGSGLVNLNMTFWRQLAWVLEKRGYAVDVVALGRNGASTQDELHWLESPHDTNPLAQIKPDILIFGYVVNDPDVRDDMGNPLAKSSNVTGMPTLIKRTWLNHYVPPNLAAAIDERLLAKYAASRRAKSSNGPTNADHLELLERESDAWTLSLLEGENYVHYVKILDILGGVLRTLQTPAFFVSLPHIIDDKNGFELRYAKVKKDIPEHAGVPFFDLLPPFLEAFPEQGAAAKLIQSRLQANPANSHPGPAITRFYAERITDILEQHYPAVLGNKQSAKKMSPVINDWLPAGLSIEKHSDGWRMSGDIAVRDMLMMPMQKPHIACNFERPVQIQSLSLPQEGKGCGNYTVWAYILDEATGAEAPDCVLVGTTDHGLLQIPKNLVSKQITSLRIAPEDPEDWVRSVKQSPMTLLITFDTPQAQL
jgi:hypothetical protein